MKSNSFTIVTTDYIVLHVYVYVLQSIHVEVSKVEPR